MIEHGLPADDKDLESEQRAANRDVGREKSRLAHAVA